MKRSLLALVALGLAAHADERPGVKPPASVPRPEPRDFTLDNGLAVTLIPFGDLPKITVRLVFRAGNVDEADGQTWLADLTGQLLQLGTEKLDAVMMARMVAGWGGDVGINVGLDSISIGGAVIAENAPGLIGLLSDLVQHPRLPASDLPRLKGDLVRQLHIAKSQPGSIADAKLASVMYPRQPYGRYFPTEAALRGYTLEQARAFFHQNLHAGRAHLYVSGRFDSAAVERAVRAAFGDWSGGPPAPPRKVRPVSTRAIYLVDRPGAVQSTLRIAIPVTPANHPDYVPLKVMDSLLGGAFISRITANIREQKGYTYSPGSQVNIRDGDAYWVQTADVTSNATGPAIREILKEIDRLRRETPTPDEVSGIQLAVIGAHLIQLGSRDGALAWERFIDFYGLPEGLDLVREVQAVGPADVQRMAKKYLDPKRLTIVVVGDAKTVLPQLRGIARVVKE